MTVLDTPEQIRAYRLLVLRAALKLECQGMRHSSGRSVAHRVRMEFGFQGQKARILEQFEALLRKEGILVLSPGQA